MTNCSINESFPQNLIKTRDHYCSYIRRDLSPSGAPMKCCPAGTSFASFSFQPGTQCSLILYFIPSSISPLPSSLFSSMLYEAQPMDGSRSALGAGIICFHLDLPSPTWSNWPTWPRRSAWICLHPTVDIEYWILGN